MKTEESLAKTVKLINEHQKYKRYEALLSLFLSKIKDGQNFYDIPQEEIVKKIGITGKETLKGMFSALNINLLKEFKREVCLIDYSTKSIKIEIKIL